MFWLIVLVLFCLLCGGGWAPRGDYVGFNVAGAIAFIALIALVFLGIWYWRWNLTFPTS